MGKAIAAVWALTLVLVLPYSVLAEDKLDLEQVNVEQAIFQDVVLPQVVTVISNQTGVSVVAVGEARKARVSVFVKDKSLKSVLNILTEASDLVYYVKDDTDVFISTKEDYERNVRAGQPATRSYTLQNTSILDMIKLIQPLMKDEADRAAAGGPGGKQLVVSSFNQEFLDEVEALINRTDSEVEIDVEPDVRATSKQQTQSSQPGLTVTYHQGSEKPSSSETQPGFVMPDLYYRLTMQEVTKSHKDEIEEFLKLKNLNSHSVPLGDLPRMPRRDELVHLTEEERQERMTKYRELMTAILQDPGKVYRVVIDIVPEKNLEEVKTFLSEKGYAVQSEMFRRTGAGNTVSYHDDGTTNRVGMTREDRLRAHEQRVRNIIQQRRQQRQEQEMLKGLQEGPTS